jgi:hypothetical protein
MTTPPPHKKMPPVIGGEVSTTATKLLQRSEFDGVPQPEVVAELLVRLIKNNDDKARSGLRGCLSVYRTIPARAPLVAMIEKVLKS